MQANNYINTTTLTYWSLEPLNADILPTFFLELVVDPENVKGKLLNSYLQWHFPRIESHSR